MDVRGGSAPPPGRRVGLVAFHIGTNDINTSNRAHGEHDVDTTTVHLWVDADHPVIQATVEGHTPCTVTAIIAYGLEHLRENGSLAPRVSSPDTPIMAIVLRLMLEASEHREATSS